MGRIETENTKKCFPFHTGWSHINITAQNVQMGKMETGTTPEKFLFGKTGSQHIFTGRKIFLQEIWVTGNQHRVSHSGKHPIPEETIPGIRIPVKGTKYRCGTCPKDLKTQKLMPG